MAKNMDKKEAVAAKQENGTVESAIPTTGEKNQKGEKKTIGQKEETPAGKKEKAVLEKEKTSEKPSENQRNKTNKTRKETERKKVKKGDIQKKQFPKMSAKEIEEMIVNLANAGHTASEIGLILRDQHGIKKVKPIVKKTITQVLAAKKLLGDVPEDLLSLVRKSVLIRKHMKQNKKDMSAKRGYQLTVSKIRRLSKYYTKKGILPKKWRYSEETAELLVK